MVDADTIDLAKERSIIAAIISNVDALVAYYDDVGKHKKAREVYEATVSLRLRHTRLKARIDAEIKQRIDGEEVTR